MCVELRDQDGVYLRSIGDLRGWIGSGAIRISERYVRASPSIRPADPSLYSDDECLCPVDLAATFNPLGLDILWDEPRLIGDIMPIADADAYRAQDDVERVACDLGVPADVVSRPSGVWLGLECIDADEARAVIEFLANRRSGR